MSAKSILCVLFLGLFFSGLAFGKYTCVSSAGNREFSRTNQQSQYQACFLAYMDCQAAVGKGKNVCKLEQRAVAYCFVKGASITTHPDLGTIINDIGSFEAISYGAKASGKDCQRRAMDLCKNSGANICTAIEN